MQQSGNVTGVVTPTTSSHIIYRRTIDEIAKKLARSSTGTHLPVRATKNSSCSHPCRGLRDECWRKSSVQIVHKPRKGVMHFHQRIVEDRPEKVPRQHSVVGSSEKLIALLKRAVAVVRLLRCSSCQIDELQVWSRWQRNEGCISKRGNKRNQRRLLELEDDLDSHRGAESRHLEHSSKLKESLRFKALKRNQHLQSLYLPFAYVS